MSSFFRWNTSGSRVRHTTRHVAAGESTLGICLPCQVEHVRFSRETHNTPSCRRRGKEALHFHRTMPAMVNGRTKGLGFGHPRKEGLGFGYLRGWSAPRAPEFHLIIATPPPPGHGRRSCGDRTAGLCQSLRDLFFRLVVLDRQKEKRSRAHVSSFLVASPHWNFWRVSWVSPGSGSRVPDPVEPETARA
jgi:hypothetical protein